MTSLSIGLLICELLEKDSGVVALAKRVYPVSSLQDEKLPYIVYTRTTSANDSTKNDMRDSVSFFVDCYADTYAGAVNVAEAARRALEGRNFVYSASGCELHADWIKLMDASEGYSDDAFIVRLQFAAKVWYK